MNEIEQLAEDTSKSVCGAVIAVLKGLESSHPSDDSVLNNAWEDICVQMQSEQSPNWETTYEFTILQHITAEINKLPKATLEAIWLQTDQGLDWDETGSPPVFDENIADYIMNHYVLPTAEEDESPNVQNSL